MTTEEMKQIIQHRRNQWANCNMRTDNLYEKALALMEWASKKPSQEEIDKMIVRYSDIISEDCKHGLDAWDKVDQERYNRHATGLVKLIDDFLKEDGQ